MSLNAESIWGHLFLMPIFSKEITGLMTNIKKERILLNIFDILLALFTICS